MTYINTTRVVEICFASRMVNSRMSFPSSAVPGYQIAPLRAWSKLCPPVTPLHRVS